MALTFEGFSHLVWPILPHVTPEYVFGKDDFGT